MRVGLGYDVHAFASGRSLILGGVEIPHEAGLAGHSDADVLSHAVADALLGAAALGDLGTHFPNDERWRDASSLDILREVGTMLRDGDLRVVNVDATVIAERPRLAPFRDAIRGAVAEALDVEPAAVSIKVTSTDGLGATGRGEGIAAMAVALVDPLG